MIDHASLPVRDYERSKRFYTQALAAIGYKLVREVPADKNPTGLAACGFGAERPEFWIAESATAPHLHLAFGAGTRALVDAFYAAALAAGGQDNGAPGPRPQYHANYYGAFVIDPDGHNVEAVCRVPPA